MKYFKHIIILIITLFSFQSCLESDNYLDNIYYYNEVPTQAEFEALFENSLADKTQILTCDTSDNWVSFTSEEGVTLSFNASCLEFEGNLVTGAVEVEFVEIFDKGDMLTTNKPTMGLMADGINKDLLISGGEFYIQAKQGENLLTTTCGIQLQVPVSLTGTANTDMTLWTGVLDEDGDLTWEEIIDATGQENGIGVEGDNYYCYFGDFGWTNVDVFYSDPRPKTTILVDVPEGYDDENAAVFLSYDGNGNHNLAYLDTYDAATGLFTEHYGQIPIGLECHVIFISESDGLFTYAIKPVTIVEDEIIVFTTSELQVLDEAGLTALINALP